MKQNPFNSDFNAILNGLDPQSPYAPLHTALGGIPPHTPHLVARGRYVTQRTQRSYFWYKVGDGEVDGTEVRDRGNALATIDAGLSCGRFRNKEWVGANRPEWPPNLVRSLDKYVADVPQKPIVMPPKGSPPSKGELVF